MADNTLLSLDDGIIASPLLCSLFQTMGTPPLCHYHLPINLYYTSTDDCIHQYPDCSVHWNHRHHSNENGRSSLHRHPPTKEPPPFAYPRWMLILPAFMISNHTWTFWIKTQGLVLYPAPSQYHPKSQQPTLQHPLQGIFGLPTQNKAFSLVASMQSNLTEHAKNALHLNLDGFKITADNCTTAASLVTSRTSSKDRTSPT